MLLEAFCVKNGVRGVEMIHISNQIILSLTQSLLQASGRRATQSWPIPTGHRLRLKALAKKLVRGVINKINSGQRHGPGAAMPGTRKGRVEVLRKAIMDIIKDSDCGADLKKQTGSESARWCHVGK
jgi:hypothetical protein